MNDLSDQVAQVARVAAKLLAETERLRRDVVILHGRIEPFENEVRLPKIEERKLKIRNLVEALNVLDTGRRAIKNCEAELSAIRGKMDSIEKDAHLRDDLKPYLKEPPIRHRRG